MSNATAKIEVHLDVETQIQMKILIGEFFSNQWKYFKSIKLIIFTKRF